MARRRYKKRIRKAIALICVIAFVAILCVVARLNTYELEGQIRGYEQKEELLEKQIIEEEERTDSLIERKKYITTDEYYKEIAKEKLGLLEQDEVLLKEKNE